jgi:hypothetical protein
MVYIITFDGKRRHQCVSHELGRSARELDELARSHEGPVLISRVTGLATGLELRGPDARRPRDWALVGQFEVTDAIEAETTCANRLFHKQTSFFLCIRPALVAGRVVEFAYDFYVEIISGKAGTRVRFKYCFVDDDVYLPFEEMVSRSPELLTGRAHDRGPKL